MRAAIAYQRALANLVWSELQDASSRTSQPHIGSDERGTKGINPSRQGPASKFCAEALETLAPSRTSAPARSSAPRKVAQASRAVGGKAAGEFWSEF